MSSYSEFAQNLAGIIQSGATAQAEAQRQRGQIWGQALSNIGQIVSSIPAQQQQAQALKLRAQAQGLETQKLGLEVQKTQREQQTQDQVKAVLMKHGGDFDAALPEISQIDPALGMEIGTRLHQSKLATLDYQQRQFKAEKDKLDWLHEQIGSAMDDASYLQALHTVASALGPDALKGVPAQYDPATVKAYDQAALTAKERLDAQMKQADDQREMLRLQAQMQNQATDNARQAASEKSRESYQQAELGIRRAELGLAQQKEKFQEAQGPAGTEDMGIASDVRTTATGRQYVDLSKYKGKDYHVAQQQAKAAGVYGASAPEVDALQNIDTARQNMALIAQNLNKLPSSAATRNIGGGLVNKAEAYLQLDPALAAWGTWRTAAIQAMRALAGSKGLRINRSEIEASMENDVPNITDTQATAAEKLRRVDAMLGSQERGLMGSTPATAPTAPAAPKNPFR